MNESAAHRALDFGHMTEEERHRILLDANERQTRIYEERLNAAERRGLVEGERRGLVEGERRGLLEAARAALSVHRPAGEVESAVSALQQCTSNDEIKLALGKLLR